MYREYAFVLILYLVIPSGEHSHAPGPHHEASVDSCFLAFRIAILSITVSIRIDAQMPCAPSVKIRKSDRDIFPERINCYIDQVIFAILFIISGEAHAECTRITRNIHFLCIKIMRVDRIHSTDRSRELFVDNRMLFAPALSIISLGSARNSRFRPVYIR